MESLLKDEGRWLITASDRLPPRHFSAGPCNEPRARRPDVGSFNALLSMSNQFR